MFRDEDYEIGISQASIAVVPSAQLWIAFLAAIYFRWLLTIVCHLAIFRLQFDVNKPLSVHWKLVPVGA